MNSHISGHVTIKPSDLSSTVKQALDDLNMTVQEKVNEAAEKTAKDTANELKSSSPVRSDGFKRKYPPGSYAKSWTYENTETNMGAKTFVVKNKKHYQLTHLLEHGHIIKATGKRSEAFPHIAPAEKDAIEEFTTEVKGMDL